MFTTLALLAVLLCPILTDAGSYLNKREQPDECNDRFSNERKTYKILTRASTWQGAKRKCSKIGGRLAEATNEGEHTFLQQILEQHDACNNARCPEHSYWVGAHQILQDKDIANEDRVFQWEQHGVTVDPEFWFEGEPNNWRGQTEKCAQYAPGYWFAKPDLGYFINDRRCNVKFCFVCEL